MACTGDGSMESISIIIRSKNEEQFIGQTIEKISAQEFRIPYEVIVIDSGSTDRTVEIAARYPVNLVRIPPESFTFGYALNYGIEKAKGTIIVNLSAHCVPTNSFWLEELVRPIIDSNVHATFGRQVALKGLNAFEEVVLRKVFPEDAEIKGRQPFSNANCAFLKKMWVERRFDEELSSWEDYLWYLLMKDKYAFCYCPKASVYHTHPFSIKTMTRRAYIDGKAFKLIKKKYNIDLLGGAGQSLKTKTRMFSADVRNHIKLFGQAGYRKYLVLIPLVRFLAYRAYWKGYRSEK
jgi:rhamnosyltransferase